VVRDGDVIRLDAPAGRLEALVPHEEWIRRDAAKLGQDQRKANGHGLGRELFAAFRRNATEAEEGACTWL
jgi:phosphogluconate dehydratase